MRSVRLMFGAILACLLDISSAAVIISDRAQGNLTWSDWSDWSPCSASCGYGEQSRHRSCHIVLGDFKIKSYGCFGEKVQKIECRRHHWNCPFSVATSDAEAAEEMVVPKWSAWSTWSDCSVSCGEGRQTRFRGCIDAHLVKVDPSSCMGKMFDNGRCILDVDCLAVGVKGNVTMMTTNLTPSFIQHTIIISGIIWLSVVGLIILVIVCLAIRRWRGRQPYKCTSRGGKHYISPFETEVKKTYRHPGDHHKEEMIFYDIS